MNTHCEQSRNTIGHRDFEAPHAAATLQRRRDVLRKARQCSALLTAAINDIATEPAGDDEFELLGLARDIAADVYHEFWSVAVGNIFPGDVDNEGAGISGSLHATLLAVFDSADLARRQKEAADSDLLNRTGWLHYSASDLARRLVALLESADTQEGTA